MEKTIKAGTINQIRESLKSIDNKPKQSLNQLSTHPMHSNQQINRLMKRHKLSMEASTIGEITPTKSLRAFQKSRESFNNKYLEPKMASINELFLPSPQPHRGPSQEAELFDEETPTPKINSINGSSPKKFISQVKVNNNSPRRAARPRKEPKSFKDLYNASMEIYQNSSIESKPAEAASIEGSSIEKKSSKKDRNSRKKLITLKKLKTQKNEKSEKTEKNEIQKSPKKTNNFHPIRGGFRHLTQQPDLHSSKRLLPLDSLHSVNGASPRKRDSYKLNKRMRCASQIYGSPLQLRGMDNNPSAFMNLKLFQCEANQNLAKRDQKKTSSGLDFGKSGKFNLVVQQAGQQSGSASQSNQEDEELAEDTSAQINRGNITRRRGSEKSGLIPKANNFKRTLTSILDNKVPILPQKLNPFEC